jgi:ADP-ribose pyrophosphatase
VKLEPWRLKERRELLRIDPWLTVSTDRVELPDGRVVEDYIHLDQPAYALVFAETEDRRVIVARQYRHGVGRICLSFPGGALNRPDEPPEEAAARELMEETGYRAAAWSDLGAYATNANSGGATAYYFRATGCRRVAEPNSGDLEDMDIGLMTYDELFAAARNGEFPVVSQIALLTLATHPVLDRS